MATQQLIQKHASRALQSWLNALGANLVVDGALGPRTAKALTDYGDDTAKSIRAHIGAVALPAKTVVKDRFFGELVPAATKMAVREGLIPEAVIAQLAHESGWGRSGLAAKYNNFGGMKYNLFTAYPGPPVRSSAMRTKEFEQGRSIDIIASFAVFDDVDHFVDAYAWYLLRGPSAYRYPRLAEALTPKQYFSILKAGGYATNPRYVDDLVSIVSSVKRRVNLTA